MMVRNDKENIMAKNMCFLRELMKGQRKGTRKKERNNREQVQEKKRK